MNTQIYKGFKIIKNGDRYYSIMRPCGSYLCDATSLKQAKLIIINTLPLEKLDV